MKGTSDVWFPIPPSPPVESSVTSLVKQSSLPSVIIPYYILVMCALIYGILRQESRAHSKFRKAIAQRPAGKQEGETYFDSLRKQWSEKS
ncbi:hypothetical protein ANCDUO_04478 [Ancylostoma duodenale]|uniref:Uncharacterized protein n=1 Tax=Ancylostoma duodenale TaxID=51022 RepID=A0A0C2DR45_9BILA|nr:hypothetical protein ANCDUO_04478 [Ancylostoma duodenale]